MHWLPRSIPRIRRPMLTTFATRELPGNHSSPNLSHDSRMRPKKRGIDRRWWVSSLSPCRSCCPLEFRRLTVSYFRIEISLICSCLAKEMKTICCFVKSQQTHGWVRLLPRPAPTRNAVKDSGRPIRDNPHILVVKRRTTSVADTLRDRFPAENR